MYECKVLGRGRYPLRKIPGGARLCFTPFFDYVLSLLTASPIQLETSQGAIGVAPYLLCSPHVMAVRLPLSDLFLS